MKLPYGVNLMGYPHSGPDDVVTGDGEIIGTSEICPETDALINFPPSGASELAFCHL